MTLRTPPLHARAAQTRARLANPPMLAFDPEQTRDPDGKWGNGLGEIIAEAVVKLRNGNLTVQARHGDDEGDISLSDGERTITLDAREQHALSRALRSDSAEEYGKRHHGTAKTGPRTELLWRVTNGGDNEAGIAQDHALTLAGPDDGVDELDARPGLGLTDKQAQELEDTAARLSVARRLDTGNGPMDAWVTQDDGVGLRMKDEHGDPTEVTFSDKDWAKISHALNVVTEGFDADAIPADAPDDYEPPEVHGVTVKTAAGPVEIEWHGPRDAKGYDPKANFTIVPLSGAAWSVAVNGDHMSDVLGRFSWLQDIAGIS